MPKHIVYEAYKVLELVHARIDACQTLKVLDEIQARFESDNIDNELGELAAMLNEYPAGIRENLRTIIEENRAIILHYCQEKRIILQNPGTTL